jgi:RES domain-containing protein
MEVWRVTTAGFAGAALSGEGAARFGGRWNPRGLALVYTSSSLSLAILELLVQTGARVVPGKLCSIRLDIPSDIERQRLEPGALPANWRAHPAPVSLQMLGRDWIEGGTTTVLSVPSAVVPEERNYLLNPVHPDFGRISIVSTSRIDLDRRLTALLRRGGPPAPV